MRSQETKIFQHADKRRYTIKLLNEIPTIKETIERKQNIKSHRKSKYEKRHCFYRQNKIFQADVKKLYRETRKAVIKFKRPPSTEKVNKKKLGENIWRIPKEYIPTAE